MNLPTNPATPGQFGIDDVRDVVRFGARLTRAFRLAMSDGKINLKDVRFVFDVIPTIKPALDGSKQVKSEVLDLSPDELTQLAEFFAQEADIPYSPIIRSQLQQKLSAGDGILDMVVAMTRIGEAPGTDELRTPTE